MLNKWKISIEYYILSIAWLFWGFSQSLMWIQESKKPNYSIILSTVSVQTFNCLLMTLVAISLIFSIRRKVQKFKSRIILFVMLMIIASLGLVFVNIAVYLYFNGKASLILHDVSIYLINGTEKLIYLSGFCTMFFLIRNLKEIQIQKNIAAEAQQAARDAQLQTLQQQLSPHFLFNTLNSLRSLINVDSQRAREMVTDLSEFLRIILASNKSVQNTISNEITLLEHYLKIQKIRFSDDLQYNIVVSKDAENFIVPKFILQPLVENAIKFGMLTSSMPLKVTIHAFFENKVFKIRIQNTGQIVEPSIDEHNNNGLRNTQTRLKLMYSNGAAVTLTQSQGQVYAEIRIEQ